jgi:hypothetical protein
MLSQAEVTGAYRLFLGSQATDYGEGVIREEL